jgi:hypothetical protein
MPVAKLGIFFAMNLGESNLLLLDLGLLFINVF